jgi:hypothetical protein
MAYAVKHIYEKNFKMYFLWAMVAMSFHVIAALLLLIYPLVNKNINRFILIGIIIGLFFIVKFTHITMSIMNFATLLFPKYTWYINSRFMEPAAVSSGLGVILKISIALSIIFFKDKIVKKYKQANIAINMHVLYIVALIFHLKLSVFGRVEHAFVIFTFLSVVYFINTFEKKGRVIVLLIIGLLYYIIFMKYIVTGTKDIDNDVYINPYQIILDRR